MKPRQLYPIFLDLRRRLVVVVGGGAVAERKVRGLLECGAEVRIVAPKATEEIEQLAADRRVEWLRREFHAADVNHAFLVFAATNDAAVNTRVCQACDSHDIPVNRAESPEASDFIVPATLRRGELAIAVSTGGASPHLGQILRDRLALQFGADYAAYVRILETARREVMEAVSDPKERQSILRALAEDAELLKTLQRDGEAKALERARAISKS